MSFCASSGGWPGARASSSRSILVHAAAATARSGSATVTTLRSSRPKEFPSGTLRAMLAQIGVDPREL
jgi:hypothetical protein